ncbi:XRE family transcriptional regulator [Nocardia carnea]|uniref:XRE family transcriptional regulator n=1 Tax=Nocardia carnea TaxID=37328 RepID=UPI002456F06F|nr:XRE family transcriptional regulator [Nocardia carnea]
MAIRYLNKKEFAERIGVKEDTLNRYKNKLPPEDCNWGPLERPGWLAETIDAWNARRPGPGNRADQTKWWLPPEFQ